MPAAKELGKDLSAGVALIAGAVSVVGTLITSGITLNAVSSALQTASGAEASVGDVLTVFDVALATYPIVLGVFVTAILVEYKPFTGWSLFWALCAVWGAAAVLTKTKFGDGSPIAPTGGTPLGLLGGLVEATFAPYTMIAAVQGIVVGGGTYLLFRFMRDKHFRDSATH